jgi:hypothetical protein
VPALILIALVALRSQVHSLESDVREAKVQQRDLRTLEESDRSRLNARDERDVERDIAFCKGIPQAGKCKELMAMYAEPVDQGARSGTR